MTGHRGTLAAVTLMTVLGLAVLVASAGFVGTAAANGTATIDENILVEDTGDAAYIPITLVNNDTATLTVGEIDNDNYQVNATVEDGNGDGTVIVRFNTYAAGAEANYTVFETVDAADSVQLVDPNPNGFSKSFPRENLLAPADYQLFSVAGSTPPIDADRVEDDLATLSLDQRTTDAISVWRAPGDADLSDAAAIRDRLEDGSLTATSEIASGDRLVHRLDVSGLEGAIRTDLTDRQSHNTTDAFLNLTANHSTEAAHGIASNPNAEWDLWVNETDGESLAVNHSTIDVVPDYENDTYWVVYDLEATDTPITGDVFETSFTVLDDNDMADSDQEVTADWGYVAADVTLETDENGNINLHAASNQTIAGMSTVAPGTELTVRVYGTDSCCPFVKPLSTLVNPDGSFEVTENFSGNFVGANYTIRVRRGSETLSLTDGTVQSGVAVESLDVNDPHLSVGETANLTVTATLANGTEIDVTDNASFTTTDAAVFTITDSGTVTAEGPGTANVSVDTPEGTTEGVITVEGPDAIPATYYGTVTINGNPAPNGTVVTAQIDNETRGTIETDGGAYGGPGTFDDRLVVSGAVGEENATVRFIIEPPESVAVAGPANQTATFDPEADTELNLTATLEEPIPPIYNASIPNDGESYVIGFPGPVNGTLEDQFSGYDGIQSFWVFENESWERITDPTHSLEALDALAITTSGSGPASIPITISLAPDTVASKATLEHGWNLVAAPAQTDAESAFGTGDALVVLDRYGLPSVAGVPSVGPFEQYIVGSTAWGEVAPTVSPFSAYFVYVDGTAEIPVMANDIPHRQAVDEALGLE